VQLSTWFRKRCKRMPLCGRLACTIAVVGPMQPGCTKPVTACNTGNELIPAASRTVASDFTITDVKGHRVTLSQYRGKVVLLDFWATTRGGCKVEIPWYVEFDKIYRDKGSAVVGINEDGESAINVRSIMVNWHMVYPVVMGNDAVRERFIVQQLPLTFLIDRSGRIAVSHAGIVDKIRFEGEIKEPLK
jgi:peroxiredoxin